jgi:predicted Fe-S protein YdhL (DUF1289 family)
MGDEIRVPSPCIGLCQKENGACLNCKRTMDEITKWSDMSETEKAAIFKRIIQGTDYEPVTDPQKEFAQRYKVLGVVELF